MCKVKICGVKRREDIEYVNCFKPDYIGFVFAESRRRLSIEKAKELGSILNNGINKVGVFVDESMENILKTCLQCELDIVQLHGNESPEFVDSLKNIIKNGTNLNIGVWKAIRMKDMGSTEQMKDFDVDAFILDTFTEGTYGGAGEIFDWNLAVGAKKYGKIFLAGGLNHQNIQGAIRIVEPYGVDTSSGVELDGFKDEGKIREFISKVRIPSSLTLLT